MITLPLLSSQLASNRWAFLCKATIHLHPSWTCSIIHPRRACSREKKKKKKLYIQYSTAPMIYGVEYIITHIRSSPSSEYLRFPLRVVLHACSAAWFLAGPGLVWFWFWFWFWFWSDLSEKLPSRRTKFRVLASVDLIADGCLLYCLLSYGTELARAREHGLSLFLSLSFSLLSFRTAFSRCPFSPTAWFLYRLCFFYSDDAKVGWLAS